MRPLPNQTSQLAAHRAFHRYSISRFSVYIHLQMVRSTAARFHVY
jgi:hypothetical protein